MNVILNVTKISILHKVIPEIITWMCSPTLFLSCVFLLCLECPCLEVMGKLSELTWSHKVCEDFFFLKGLVGLGNQGIFLNKCIVDFFSSSVKILAFWLLWVTLFSETEKVFVQMLLSDFAFLFSVFVHKE